MLIVNLSDENVRMLAESHFPNDLFTIDDYEDLGQEWLDLILENLNVDFKRNDIQKRGSWVIVQDGTTKERDAWDEAVDRTYDEISKRAADWAKNLAEDADDPYYRAKKMEFVSEESEAA